MRQLFQQKLLVYAHDRNLQLKFCDQVCSICKLDRGLLGIFNICSYSRESKRQIIYLLILEFQKPTGFPHENYKQVIVEFKQRNKQQSE